MLYPKHPLLACFDIKAALVAGCEQAKAEDALELQDRLDRLDDTLEKLNAGMQLAPESLTPAVCKQLLDTAVYYRPETSVFGALLDLPAFQSALSSRHDSEKGYENLSTVAHVIFNRKVGILKFLLRHESGAAHAAFDKQNATSGAPLHVAAREGCQEELEALLKDARACRALQHPDKNGQTPVHIAALKGRHPMLKLMLEHPPGSAALTCRDLDGHTPLDLAAQFADGTEAEELLRASTPPDALQAAGMGSVSALRICSEKFSQPSKGCASANVELKCQMTHLPLQASCWNLHPMSLHVALDITVFLQRSNSTELPQDVLGSQAGQHDMQLKKRRMSRQSGHCALLHLNSDS